MSEIDGMVDALWTFIGPREDPEAPGDYLLEIAELPGFVVIADSSEQVVRELPDALRVHFAAYQAAGRSVPVPTSSRAG